jgi:hypothetical protein
MVVFVPILSDMEKFIGTEIGSYPVKIKLKEKEEKLHPDVYT